MQQYLDHLTLFRKTAGKSYKSYLKPFMKFTAGEITQEKINRYFSIAKEKYQRSTFPYAVTIIKSYLRFEQEKGRAMNVSLRLIPIPKARRQSHYAVTDEEYQKMLSVLAINEPYLLLQTCILRLLHDTGMRVGELVSLDTSMVKKCTAIIYTEKTVKTRPIFWTEATDDILSRWILLRKEIIREGDALFIGIADERSDRLSTRTVERMIRHTCDQANLTAPIVPHSFRHAFIHRLAKQSVPDSVIAKLVGHSTPHTVMSYTQFNTFELENVYRRCTV